MTSQWKCDYFYCFSVNSELQYFLAALLCLKEHFVRHRAVCGLPSLCLFFQPVPLWYSSLFTCLRAYCPLIFRTFLKAFSLHIAYISTNAAQVSIRESHHLIVRLPAIYNFQLHPHQNSSHSPNAHVLSHLFLFAKKPGFPFLKWPSPSGELIRLLCLMLLQSWLLPVTCWSGFLAALLMVVI